MSLSMLLMVLASAASGCLVVQVLQRDTMPR